MDDVFSEALSVLFRNKMSAWSCFCVAWYCTGTCEWTNVFIKISLSGFKMSAMWSAVSLAWAAGVWDGKRSGPRSHKITEVPVSCSQTCNKCFTCSKKLSFASVQCSEIGCFNSSRLLDYLIYSVTQGIFLCSNISWACCTHLNFVSFLDTFWGRCLSHYWKILSLSAQSMLRSQS